MAPRALELDKNPESPVRDELIREAAQAGLMGNNLPEFLGGQGHDPLTGALVTEELAAACSGITVLLGATMLGIAPILASGDLEAINRFVKPLADSWESDQPRMAALAATEPGLGSDFIQGHSEGRARTRVERKADGYLINGRKIFISNGSLASLVTVFASHDPNAPIRESMSCFAVPTDTPGFSVGQIFDKMGQRACPATELLFDDVFVPDAHLIGKERAGWELNRLIMSVTRTPVATIALGIARAAYDRALDYATERIQGGKPIVRHQAIQLLLADMSIRVEAARGLVWKSAAATAAGKPSLKLASMAKTFASDAAVANATDAIQVMGGNGYMREYGVEKLLRDAKLTQIYEGTNQINRFEIMEAVMEEIGS
ncbi:MAG: acyl-CoA dehydrogenase family protein [Deltaproteobacteria bacterium]|nr:acyl-CoA dehydrogenase family protein [Deltaproteobacteria bacterium]